MWASEGMLRRERPPGLTLLQSAYDTLQRRSDPGFTRLRALYRRAAGGFKQFQEAAAVSLRPASVLPARNSDPPGSEFLGLQRPIPP